MNADSHNLTQNGQYTPSDRARKAQSAATAHMGGRTGKPFYGEGMHQGNTTPAPQTTNTKPAKGATPPNVKNPTQQPGLGADNSAIKRSSKV